MTSSADVSEQAKRSTFEFAGAPRWFRIVAFAEAVSWVGLLTGMYFKYLGTPRTEVGVQVFGMAHGLIFIAFVVLALLVGITAKWRVRTWALALLASIVPLASVIFLMWADRTGRMEPPGLRQVGAEAAVSGRETT
jgi:integral membrane protein